MFKRLVLASSFALTLIFLAAGAFAQTGLAQLQLSAPNRFGTMDGIATFGGVIPTTDQLNALRGLGLQVQGLSQLPLALLRGPKSAMLDAVSRGLAKDVYPNLQLQFFSSASDLAIRANEVQAMGVDGTGVSVAVVDSGIDATHPDLARRVTHNVKIIETDTAPDIVIPVDQGPYNDSDTSSGHGTHVAGIIAADNTDGQVLGVAPGANLVGYGTGDAIFVFGVLTAYNDLISHRGDWNIRVVNNSWGSSFRLFDPDEPINQATKRAHDAGIVVAFAAGNSSTEMSINPYSVAPWVISTGNGALNHQRDATSSGGLQFDNSVLMTLPTTDLKYLGFTGDRIGLYHPSVSAPGVNIVSTGTTGAAVTSTPGGTATASGTSMATPHVSGTAALMIQRNPKLTPDEVKSALQVTSTLMPDTTDASLVQPFYQVGYGFIDAKSAVDLVSRARYNVKALAKLQSKADQRVLGDRDDSVLRTDYWTFTAAAATVNGVPDNRTFTFPVSSTTKAMKALVSYPSLGYVGINEFNYQLTITDAAGKTIATTTPASNAGMSQVFFDVPPDATFGTWSVNVNGQLGAQDQDTIMGILVSVAVHQLQPQVAISPTMPTFTPSGTLTYYLQPGTAGALTSPEGCNLQAGTPVGGLASERASGACQSGMMGYALNYGASIPAMFTSGALASPLTVGGTMTIKFYLTDPVQPVWTASTSPRLGVEVDAVDDSGNLLMAIAASDLQVCSTDTSGNKVCNTGPQPVGGTYTMSIPPVTIPAGAHLSVVFRETAAVTSSSRTVYGGRGLSADFSDAGVTFTTGTLQ